MIEIVGFGIRTDGDSMSVELVLIGIAVARRVGARHINCEIALERRVRLEDPVAAISLEQSVIRGDICIAVHQRKIGLVMKIYVVLYESRSLDDAGLFEGEDRSEKASRAEENNKQQENDFQKSSKREIVFDDEEILFRYNDSLEFRMGK